MASFHLRTIFVVIVFNLSILQRDAML